MIACWSEMRENVGNSERHAVPLNLFFQILINFCVQKFDHSIGIVRVTAIMDLFYALETQVCHHIIL